MKTLKVALENYERDPIQLKFISLNTSFHSLKIGTIIEDLKNESDFYEKISKKLKLQTDDELVKYIRTICTSLEICRKEWERIGNYFKKKHNIAIKDIRMSNLLSKCNEELLKSNIKSSNLGIPLWSKESNASDDLKRYKKCSFYGPTFEDILVFQDIKVDIEEKDTTVSSSGSLESIESATSQDELFGNVNEGELEQNHHN